jgi:hypothetical protein
MKTRIALVIACAALGAQGLVSASASTPPLTPSTIKVSALGGSATIYATVKNARTCVWTSSPRIAQFDVTLKCHTGEIERSAKLSANNATKAKRYTIALAAIGNRVSVRHWVIIEAGTTPPTTTTTVPPTTTTTTVLTTRIPFTYTQDVTTCTGVHVVTQGQSPEDIETCVSPGSTNVGTFQSNPGSPYGVGPWGYSATWTGDYYLTIGETVIASSWTITSVNNSNGTDTGYVDSFYAGQTS